MTRHFRTSMLVLLAVVFAACSGSDPSEAERADAGHSGTTDGGASQPELDGGVSQLDASVPDAGLGSCAVDTPTFALRSPLRTVHVAPPPTGSDTNGDGSAERPFATIGRGARGAVGGTAVRIEPGTYSAGVYLENLRGSEQEPIWIGGTPGGTRPVIEGGAEGIHLVRPAWVVLHDLEIRGASGNGVNCDDGGDYADADAAHHVLFQRLSIHDIGGGGNQDCLKLSGLNDYAVLDSELTRCGGASSGSGIDHVGCHHGLIAGNRFQDLSGNAVQAKGGSEDIEIRANRMLRAGARAVNMGGSTGFEFFRPPLSTSAPNVEARNIRVVANLIEGSEASLAFVGCVDCLATHNTLIDPTRWVIRILQETTTRDGYTFLPASGGTFANNLVWYSRSGLSTHVNVGAGTDAPSFTFSNNLWFAHDDPSRSAPTLPVAETNAVTGSDPLFVSGGSTLQAESPARGKGASAFRASGDLAGRCYATPPSIGAYEVP